jgi:hypothetical protein
MRTRNRADTMMRRCQNGLHDVDAETPQNPLVPRSPTSRMSMVARRECRCPTPGATVPAAVTGHRPHPRAQRFTSTLS